jgi:hypothetical protein
MADPDWRRVAGLTVTPALLELWEAMDLPDPPRDGRPRRFVAAGASVQAVDYRDLGRTAFVLHANHCSRMVSTAAEIRAAMGIPKGGNRKEKASALLDRWLSWWGLLEPPAAAPEPVAPEPQEQTRMVT